MLFDPVRQRVFMLNEAEAVAWCLLGETGCPAAAAAGLARVARRPVNEAGSWLEAAAAQWCAAGLLGEAPPTAAAACNRPGGRVPVTGGDFVRRRYRVLDTVVEVAFARMDDAAAADGLLGSLKADEVPGVGCFMVHSDREGCVVAADDGRVLERALNPRQRIAALRVVLVELALGRAAGFAAVHAAAVARDGRAVLLTGHSGAGKSTLAAGCILDGWEHVADDTVLLDGDENLRPLPFPLSVKQGAWAALRRAGAEIDASGLHESLDGRPARYLAAPCLAEGPRALAAIVLPKWRAGAAPCLCRLGPRASFEALLPQVYPLANAFTSATIARVMALVGRTPCFSLSYDALAAGVGLLGTALES